MGCENGLDFGSPLSVFELSNCRGHLGDEPCVLPVTDIIDWGIYLEYEPSYHGQEMRSKQKSRWGTRKQSCSFGSRQQESPIGDNSLQAKCPLKGQRETRPSSRSHNGGGSRAVVSRLAQCCYLLLCSCYAFPLVAMGPLSTAPLCQNLWGETLRAQSTVQNVNNTNYHHRAHW